MNTTRTVFGRHHDGYIFPMLINLKPQEHCFTGVVSSIKTTEQFIIFTSQRFIVTAATNESHKLLRVSNWFCLASFCMTVVLFYNSVRLQVLPGELKGDAVKLTSVIADSALQTLLANAKQDAATGTRPVSRRSKVSSRVIQQLGARTAADIVAVMHRWTSSVQTQGIRHLRSHVHNKSGVDSS